MIPKTFLRLIAALTTAFGVATLVFLALRIAPGNPVDLLLHESATSSSHELLREKLGLSGSIFSQYTQYLKDLLFGNFGTSLTKSIPVSSLIKSAIPYSLLLALSASLLGNFFGISLGAFAAAYPRRNTSRIAYSLVLLLITVPVFWSAPLLIAAFSLHWPWLPIASFENWQSLILPSAALAIGLGCALFQTTRASVIEILNSEFIRTAHAKGLSPTRVLFSHALPVASVPILTVSILQFAHLLAGAVITETIFDWPGVGKLLYEAILQRDYPTVQGIVLSITLLYVVLNTLTDILNSRFQTETSANI